MEEDAIAFKKMKQPDPKGHNITARDGAKRNPWELVNLETSPERA